MRFWLDLGCDGFRVDMAESLVKGKGQAKIDAMVAIWSEVRDWFDRDWPEAVLISEWSKPQAAIWAGFHVDFLIHFGQPAYNSLFRAQGFGDVVPGGQSFFSSEGKGDITIFSDYYDKAYAATKDLGYISIPTGNHDIVPRLADARTAEELRVAMVFLFTMPGIPVIYQGDEIGMRHVPGLPSKEGGYERTGSRTPMLWDASPKAGFSGADTARFYLPLDPSVERPNVQAQESDSLSLLHFVRHLIAQRSKYPALGSDGGYRTLHAKAGVNLLVYERTQGEERIIVALNPSAERISYKIEAETKASFEVLLSQNSAFTSENSVGLLCLNGAGYLVVKVSSGL